MLHRRVILTVLQLAIAVSPTASRGDEATEDVEIIDLVQRYILAYRERDADEVLELCAPGDDLTTLKGTLAKEWPKRRPTQEIEFDGTVVKRCIAPWNSAEENKRANSTALFTVTRRGYATAVVLVVNTSLGWRVDTRWPLASFRTKTEIEDAATNFAHLFNTRQGDEILKVIAPISDTGLFKEMKPRLGFDRPVVPNWTVEQMVFVTLKDGDWYFALDGKLKVATREETTENRRKLISADPNQFWTIDMVRLDGKWKVDAGEMIRLARQHEPYIRPQMQPSGN